MVVRTDYGQYPRAGDLKLLVVETDNIRSQLKELTSKLNWYDAFSPKDAEARVHTLRDRDAQDADRLSGLSANLNCLKGACGEVEGQLMMRLDPRGWFNVEQRALRQKAASLRLELKDAEDAVDALRAQQSSRREAISQAQAELQRHAKTPISDLRQSRTDLSDRLASALSRLEALEAERGAFDVEVRPLVDQLNARELELRTARRNADLARKLDTELNTAANGFERKKVHERSEEALGTGQPKAALRQNEKIIEQTERTIEKVQRRMRELHERWSRVVDLLIIDGSNFCFASGNDFIGLSALKAALPLLAVKCNIIVVFDASIRRKLAAGDAAIKTELASAAEVIVMPTKTAADETIISRANGSPERFILSNDRYSEFQDHEAVAAGRMLRHVISSDRVQILDLKIDVPYERPNQGGLGSKLR